MKIEPIILETTRGIYNLEDKLSICTLAIFSYKLGNKTFSEFLYTSDYKGFISKLELEYKGYGINLKINLLNNQVEKALKDTVKQLRLKEDGSGYLNALYKGDEYALEIERISNTMFDNKNTLNNILKYIKELKSKV